MPFMIISTVKSFVICLFHWSLSYIITVPTVHHRTKLQYPHFELFFGDFAPAIIGGTLLNTNDILFLYNLLSYFVIFPSLFPSLFSFKKIQVPCYT